MIDQLAGSTSSWAYVLIMLAAILEGELVFAVAATLVSRGQLDPIGVLLAGALGGSIGDQFYFYALRGRLRRWLDRFPAIATRGHQLVRRVRRRETVAVLAIRFSPGLRIALSAACAYADVPPLKFSALSLLSSLVWAGLLLGLIAWAGPAWLPGLGISGWWAAIVPALILIVVVRWVANAEKRALG